MERIIFLIGEIFSKGARAVNRIETTQLGREISFKELFIRCEFIVGSINGREGFVLKQEDKSITITPSFRAFFDSARQVVEVGKGVYEGLRREEPMTVQIRLRVV